MQKETKHQIEIDAFREYFKEFKRKRIVIYGIGRRTVTLLPGITDFRVVGLLDRDENNLGKVICGTSVITLADAEKNADIIIVNSDPTNYEIIYKRIQDVKIPVYYANGKQAVVQKKDESYREHSYWKNSYRQLLKKIEQYDRISFDLFDTLVMRKVLDPADVFRLVARRIEERLGLSMDFVALRQKAVALQENEYADIDEIYNKFLEITNLSSEIVLKIKELELKTELDLCVPRKEMVELFRQAKSLGKKAYIISDMYMPSAFLFQILTKCGVTGITSGDIWVSCEKNASKKDGLLWEKYSLNKKAREKCLHIGDDLEGDIRVPKRYGIDTYYVMSGKTMLFNSSMQNIAAKVITLSDSVIVGLLVAKLFNNPFVLCASEGKVKINEPELFGYCVYGSMLTRFLIWLYGQLVEKQEERALFFARDGYFLLEDFQYLQKVMGLEKFPECVYLPISRRLIYLVTIRDEADFRRVAEFPFVGTFREYMYSRFQINVTDESGQINDVSIDVLKEEKDLVEWMAPYYDELKTEILAEQKHYISYLRGEDLWESDRKDAVVDLSFYGTNQFYYQRLVGKKVGGYYFWCCHAKENAYKRECRMSACYNDESDPEAKKSLSKEKLSFLECFLTAPYGMIRSIDENGALVCEPDKMSQANFGVKERMNQGVKAFMADYLKIAGVENGNGIGGMEEFAYREFLSGNCEIAEAVLEGLYWDNDMVGGRQMRLEV